MKTAYKHALTASFLSLLVACGGGGGGADTTGGTSSGGTTGGGTTSGGTTGGGTTGGGSSTPVQTNTQAVLNYINTRHASVQPSFLSTAQPTAQKHAALGSLQGGNHLAESINNYMSAVQSFLNDSVTNARSLNALLPVDSASVATLLRTYKTQDANYVTTYYSNWAFGTVSAGVINDAKARVNNAYDAAIANLP
jgi:hypothetical protein